MLPKKKELFVIMLVALLFIGATYMVRQYEGELEAMMYLSGYWGMATYVGITILAVVAAPISTFPLLPIATALWGPWVAAALSIFGWTLGSVIAFLIAQSYGQKLVRSFVDLDRAQTIANAVAGKNPFFSILILRMLVPVDLLSYAVGLFSTIPLWQYALATLIGVTPFAIVFAFAAGLPITYQVAVLVLAIVVAIVGYARYRTRVLSQPEMPAGNDQEK